MTKLMKQPGYLYGAGPTRLVMATEPSPEDMLRLKTILSGPSAYKLTSDTLPKSILVAYNHDSYEIKYISANYSEEILALNNKYVNSDDLTDEQVEIVAEFDKCEPLETIDLSLYSHLVTVGWIQ